MSKCKCKYKSKVISNIVSGIDENHCGECGCAYGYGDEYGCSCCGSGSDCDMECECRDVCANPICGDPAYLGIMAPLIYDEIGINLCTTFPLGADIPTAYPAARKATIRVINAIYAYSAPNIRIDNLAGRTNCYEVTLSNITIQFAIDLYDSCCRYIATLTPTAVYLPSDTATPTYDEDTNPSSATLQIFAPYGLSYSTATPPTPIINFIGLNADNNYVRQGLNLFAMAKLLDLDIEASTVTVGLTLVLQSLYFVGYKVKSQGKIDIPKGCIISEENSQCRRFVVGKLLNLAIKPLDLGCPLHEEKDKKECNDNCCNKPCDGECGTGAVGTDVSIL